MSLSSAFFPISKVGKFWYVQDFLMHSIKKSFDKILCTLKEVLGGDLPSGGNLVRPGPKPIFSDIEVVALSLTQECLGIDSELLLFAKIECDYKADFPNLISRRQYNDRRKSLFGWQELIRQKFAICLNEITDVFAVDSMPLEVCKLARMQRNKMGKECEYSAPNKGWCSSQKKYFFGYKLHCICSASGVIQMLDLSKASIHDVHYLKGIGNTFKNCIITGDRGYINKLLKEELLKKYNVSLEVPYRNNQKEKKAVIYPLRKIRKRIETAFSQLCDQFMIQRNYAKSYIGYKTRILAKVSGMTILQFLNKFVTKRAVGHIKYALSA